MKVKILNDLLRSIDQNKPTVLVSMGVCGLLLTTVAAVKATPKALSSIDDAVNEKEDDLTKIEIVKATYKHYIPAVVMASTSVACVVYGQKVQSKRTVAIATAYKVSETAFKEYKDQVVETIGKKKEEEVRVKVKEKHIQDNQPTEKQVVITGDGDYLCHDDFSGIYFFSNKNAIFAAQNQLNKMLMDEMYASVNDLYYILGIKDTGKGDMLGWNLDAGFVEFEYSSHLTIYKGVEVPCLSISYDVQPRYDFSKLI